ncbi:MAG: thioredoxin family protein [Candidatus Angelobacter sp.]
MKNLQSWIFVAASLFAAVSTAQFKRVPLQPPAQPNPQLYKAEANAVQDIRRALASAGKQHKNVLLDFGGNWCIDCHILENAFHQPRIAPLLNDNYIVVHVDVGKYDKNLDLAKKYHVDLQKGVPSLAVLDSLGKVLYGTSDFERAHLMSEDDVIQFLDKWRPVTAGNPSPGKPFHK